MSDKQATPVPKRPVDVQLDAAERAMWPAIGEVRQEKLCGHLIQPEIRCNLPAGHAPPNTCVDHQGRGNRVPAPLPDPASNAAEPKESFQKRVEDWCLSCFGPEITKDRVERNHRFLEESLELVQSLGCTDKEAHLLVNYVYSRPVGEPSQELGGVVVTLNALATVIPMPVDYCAEKELARVWQNIDKIRAKQAAKPKHSPLPAAPSTPVGAPKAQELPPLNDRCPFYAVAGREWSSRVPKDVPWNPFEVRLIEERMQREAQLLETRAALDAATKEIERLRS